MIRNYRITDFNQVEKITQEYWKNEVKMEKELEDFIYNFLVHYYLCNHELTFVNEDDEKVNAFLISSKKEDKNSSKEFWNSNISLLSKKNQDLAYQYLEYLEYNHQRVIDHMSKDSIYLGLIASTKAHMGEKLISRLKAVAAEMRLKDIYLWTDETCNYKYYEKRNFKLIDTYDTTLYDRTLKTFIYRLDL